MTTLQAVRTICRLHEHCGCVGGAVCCLNCPLPFCRYDDVLLHAAVAERRGEVLRLTAEGLRPQQVADMLQVTRKTVQGDLDKMRGK